MAPQTSSLPGVATVLVTGATGFIGAQVTRLLVERGDDVRVAVRASSKRDALAGLDVRFLTADVTDRRALRGVERLFHVAGSTNLRLPEEELFRLNALGTRVVMEAALAEGVQRVVHVSSVAAIGPAPRGGTVDERQVRSVPLGIPYADSKLAGEIEALRVAPRGLGPGLARP